MLQAEYHFTSHWFVQGTTHQVADLLGDTLHVRRWWPTAFLEAKEIGPGVFTIRARGGLPHTFTWEFRLVESRYPNGFTMESRGDFHGRCVWSFEQQGEFVSITHDWTFRPMMPSLRYLSFLLSPILSMRHRCVMAEGEECLRLELALQKMRAQAS